MTGPLRRIRQAASAFAEERPVTRTESIALLRDRQFDPAGLQSHEPAAALKSRAGQGQRGVALLLVVLLIAAATAVSASLLERAGSVAREARARQDVLCARYGALSGLALDTPTANPAAAAALVSDKLESLSTALVRRGPSWCVLLATARCGQATRTLERTLDDPARCN